MWELTEANALDYLHRMGWIDTSPAKVETLSGGVSNVVLRVRQAERLLVVKQSRPRLQTREDWFSDLERIYREQDVQRMLSELLPAGAIPRILFSDQQHYVYAMEHAPIEACSWKQLLLKGEIDLATGSRVGTLLGLIHETTAQRPELRRTVADRRVFDQLRVEPFYRRIQERHPDLRLPIQAVIEQMLGTTEALCHGDFSPKNLLVHAQGITLVDHETAHDGDPAMDLGFFFSHLLLKAIYHARWTEFEQLIAPIWNAYQAEVRSFDTTRCLQRGFLHLGVCLLARIDGTSPVDYLREESKRQIARRLGRSLLLAPAIHWDECFARLREAVN